MRVEIAEQAVLEGARLGLVAVDRQVAALAVGLGEKRPLQPAGEARPATAAQLRLLDQVDDRLRLGVEGLAERPVAAALDVRVVADSAAVPGIAPRGGRDSLGQHGFGDGHGGLSAVSTRLEVVAAVAIPIASLP